MRVGPGRWKDSRARVRWCVSALVLALTAAGCAGDLPGRERAGRDQGWVELDSTGAIPSGTAPEPYTGWSTITEQTETSRSTIPVKFYTTSNVLHVITRLGSLESPREPGLLLVNLLSGSGAVPVATIRAEQLRRDTTTVDTAEVKVDPGTLQLYVVDVHGVTGWSVKVQAPLSAPLPLPTRR